tara:strand:- start:2734 stop:4032 length:1299 start_codon:yes stop_codon:yes gene_type:complete
MRANSYRQINTDALIKSIQSLPKNNEHSIFCIKAVFIKYNSEEWEYFVGKCEIGTTEEDSETIYSDCAFICKTITDISLAAFLKTVDGEGFTLSQDMPPIKKSKDYPLNWNEELIPSHSTHTGYPIREYSVSIHDARHHFDDSKLLGFNMPFYFSSSEYLKNFMGMMQFHGNSDTRRGQLIISITDKRGRIIFDNSTISLESIHKNVCLVGQASDEEKILLKPKDTYQLKSDDQTKLELWLLTDKNEILDFHSKSELQYKFEKIEDDESRQYLAQIENGEGQETEFKTYIQIDENKNSKAEQIERTVCAFSNAQGGRLFIGVTDDTLIEGIDEKVTKHYQTSIEEAVEAYKKGIKKRVTEILRDNQCIEVFSTTIATKHIVIVNVTRSPETNYYLATKQAYIRKGGSSVKMASAEERDSYKNSPHGIGGLSF